MDWSQLLRRWMAVSQISIRCWRNTEELFLPQFPVLMISYFTKVIVSNPQQTAQRLEMTSRDEICSCYEGFTPVGWIGQNEKCCLQIILVRLDVLWFLGLWQPIENRWSQPFLCWVDYNGPPAELTSKIFEMRSLGFIVLWNQNIMLLLKVVFSTKQ